MSDFADVVIRASAGTGKTFQLSNRYLKLLTEGVPPDEILATTFTRKAAAEIQDRVMVRLADAALDEEAAIKLGGELEIPGLTMARCRDLLARLTRDLHRLRIGTLDSFFAQIARSFSLDMRLPPGWRIVEDIEDRAYRDEAIQTLLRGGSAGEIGRIVQLMTKGDAERSISELIRQTVRDLHELYLATEPTAWQRFPSYSKLRTAELFDVITALGDVEFAESPAMKKPRDADLASAQLADWESFLKGGLAAKVLDGSNKYYRKPIPAAAVELYERLIGHARGVLVDQLKHQTEASYKLLDRFNTIYQQMKYAARVMGFADVTRAVADATLDNVERMHFRLDGRVNHLLLDEFQDTSLDQWQVVRPFARRIVAETDKHASPDAGKSLFCVGDLKQSIYGWRGGVPEIFDAVEKELPGLTGQSLTRSFRSSQPVIDSVNRLFANLSRHPNLDKLQPAVARWQDQFQTHTTNKTELPGYVELATAPLKTDNQSQPDATISACADRIAGLVRQTPAATIGVLARKNNTVARLIFELRKRHVHASEEGGNPLTDSAAVALVLSLLRLADHPADTIARAHIALSPFADTVGLTRYDDEPAAERLAAQIRRRIQTQGYGPTINEWSQQLSTACNRRDASRLQQLVALAYSYQPMAGLRAHHFVQFVESVRVSDPRPANVRVMTIHKSKGLQFDIVMLPELDADIVGQPDAFVIGQPEPTEPVDRVCLYRNAQIQALLPTDMQAMFAKATDQAVTEAMCVLYVAVTRAVHALYMLIAPSASKTIPRKFSGLLRSALCEAGPIEPETALYAHGDPQWYEKPHAPQPLAEPSSPAAAPPLEIKLAPRRDARTSGDTVSPSSLAGGGRSKVADLLQLESDTALARGTLIHAWFERIGWLEDGRPDEAALRRAAQRYGTAGLDVDKLVNDFYEMIERPAVAGLLNHDNYANPTDSALQALIPESSRGKPIRAEVYPERTFAIHENGQLVYGSIDRLVLMYDQDRLVAADVIDFKTDELPVDDTGAVNAKVGHYRPQLNAYRAAVASTFGLAPQQIAARLAFVGVGTVASV